MARRGLKQYHRSWGGVSMIVWARTAVEASRVFEAKLMKQIARYSNLANQNVRTAQRELSKALLQISHEVKEANDL